MRLDKFLAHAGLGTRRYVRFLLSARRVTVNQSVQRDGAIHVREEDVVCLDGKALTIPAPKTILFYKPPGLVTSTRDSQETIYSILPFDPEKLKPIGRLDKETEGLLLLTEEGELNHGLCSPRRHVEKEYLAELDREVEEKQLLAFHQTLTLENGEKARAALQVEITAPRTVRLVIDEGKYHQVRRMFAALGFRVMRLVRTRVGPVVLTGVAAGEHRELNPEERAALRKAAGL